MYGKLTTKNRHTHWNELLPRAFYYFFNLNFIKFVSTLANHTHSGKDIYPEFFLTNTVCLRTHFFGRMAFPALASNLPQSLLKGKDPEFTPRNVNVLRLKLWLLFARRLDVSTRSRSDL
uniref:(northern house mosquito) hypothetical protein n=1 Tax=Culex pipiens TaxID=7175 RepID=A0A8D8CGD1_CULPI